MSLCVHLRLHATLCNPVIIQFHRWGRLSVLPAVTLTAQDNPTLPCNALQIILKVALEGLFARKVYEH